MLVCHDSTDFSMSYLAESFRLGVLLKAKGREMDTATEDPGLGQNTDTANAINLHLHIGVAVRVAKIGKMGSPGRVFRITLDNDGILIEGVGESQGSLGLLPRVQIVGLFSAEPVGQGTPNV